ncbi:hypothetical protein V1460_24850 [Streptomyces sp. SCSIO 30461]|uniref:hypothetical protein n=1 Tax=Streptomyces sp. SCSIO 30461 TaxID=3118085 RepID=UPI0030CB4A81
MPRPSGERLIKLTLTETDGTLPDPVAGSTWVEFGTTTLTRNGEPFGTWGYQGVVLAVDGDVRQQQVVGTFNTPDGQITTQLLDQNVESRDPSDRQTSAITGGTGRFSNVRGYIEAREDGTQVVVHLLER